MSEMITITISGKGILLRFECGTSQELDMAYISIKELLPKLQKILDLDEQKLKLIQSLKQEELNAYGRGYHHDLVVFDDFCDLTEEDLE